MSAERALRGGGPAAKLRRNGRTTLASSRRLRLLASGLCGVLLALLPCGTHAGAAPDSARFVAMNREFGARALVRVHSADETFLLRGVRAGEAGLTGQYGSARPSSITSTTDQPRLVAWADIERAERSGSYATLGAKLGFLAGVCAGFALAATVKDSDMFATHMMMVYDPVYPGYHWRRPSHLMSGLFLLYSPMVGTATGALVGSLVPRWREVAL